MKTLKKYLITLGVEVLAVLSIIYLKDIFNAADLKTVFHILCDGFFSVGVIATGIGLLVYTSNEGIFDGLVYSVKAFIDLFKKNNTRKYKTLYDYKESRAGKKLEFGYIVICGLMFLLIGIIMYCIYLFCA